MKRKHFILALVAMLWSFSFSAFADDVIVVNSWAELKAALEANDDVQRSAARQRSTAMRATDAGTEEKTPIEGTPYFLEDFDGTKVQLGDDVVYDSPMTVAKLGGATIDLNGHKVLGSEDADAHTYPIVSNGNLLVIDTKDGSGAIYCGIKTGIRNSDSNINSNAVFVMTGGNIICAHKNDDDAALVNYGIAYITGGTIEGAKNAVWNNSGAQFFAKEPALIEGEVRNDGASNIEDGVPVVAKIGTAKYTSLNAAFAAAKEGETIKMLADATPTLKSQSAITKAAVIDLNGKTLTLDKGDLYFGTTKFQNGNVVVKPGVNASTAVFWMFEKQTLTFDDVDVVATGVTGTYLIGINGGTGTAVNILNGSSITIDNSSVEKLTAVICDNGTNNNVTIDNSTITVNNIEGRFYLGGTKGDIVVNNSAVTLNGVKEGFYLRADQNLDLKGSSNVTVTLNSDEGRYGINCTEFTSIYNKEASATYTGTFFELQAAAMIGTTKYVTLQKAIDAVKDGETIVLVSDCAEAVTFTQTKDVSFVLDGNNKTYTGSINITARAGKDAASTLVIKNFNFKTDAIAHDFIKSVETNYYPNNITITNCSFEGTSDVNTAGYAVVAVRLKSANNIVITNCIGSGLHSFLQNTAGWNMQIDNVDVTNSLSGFAMGTIQGATIKNCELDVVESGIRFDAQLNNNAVLENNNVKAFVPVVVRKASVDSNIAVNGTNAMTQSNTDGYWMVIGTSEYKVNGELPTAATGRVRVSLNDDDLSEDGIYGNFVAIAKIGENEYASLQEAIKAVKDGETITLLRDDCAEDVVVTQAPDVKITIDGNNKEFAGTITVDGKSAAYATAGLTIKKVNFLADGITKDACINLGGNNAIRYTSNVTVEGCTFTGTNKDKVGVKSYTSGCKNVTITNSTAKGMHSLAQLYNTAGVTLTNNTITESKNGVSVRASSNVAISGGEMIVDGYGIRVDASAATTTTVTDVKIDANIPVIARKASGNYNIEFKGNNDFTARNADKLWIAIGAEELYDTDKGITTENLGAATGNMIVTLNGGFNAKDADGNDVAVIGAVAKVANNDYTKYYTKLQEAINACAKGDNTVYLLADVKEDVVVAQAPDVKITIAGNNKTLKGTITVDGKSARYATAALTIENVNFDVTEDVAYDACVRLGDEDNINATRYTNNVTVKECTFTDDDYSTVAIKSYTGGDWNLQIIDCEANGMHSLAQLANVEQGLVISGNTANTKNGINLNQTNVATVKENIINVKGYAVRIGSTTGGNITLTNNSLTTDNSQGDPVIELRGTVTALNMTDNAVSGNTHIKGTATTVAIDKNYWDGKSQPTVDGANVKVNWYYGSYTDGKLGNLTRNYLSGSIIGYTGTDRIWGQVWGNAFESLVIEILDANDQPMGTAKLKDESLLDGDVEVSWYIRLNGVSSNSWEVNWAAAPTVNNLPAKVKLFVDGEEVSEGNVVLNGSDNLNKINVAITDASGKILSYQQTVKAALAAVKEGEIITLLHDYKEDVVVTQAPNVKVTIDGNGKQFAGTITVDGKSAAYETAALTIKNVNFVADGIAYDACVRLGDGTNATRYTSNVTVDNCTFTGTNKDKVGVKNYTGGCKNVTITNSTATGMHSLAQLKTSAGITLANNTVTDSKNGISLGSSTGVVVESCTVKVEGYGVRTDGNTNSDVTVKGSTIEAFIPVVVRYANGEANVTFADGNKFTASNTDDLWCAIGTTEYEENGKVPAASTGIVSVTMEATDLNVKGINDIKAAIGNVYYQSFADAYADAQAGDAITLLADVVVDNSETFWISKSITINGGNHKVISNANRIFRVNASEIEVTLNEVNMVNTAERIGTNDIRGISIDPDLKDVKLTLNKCSVDFTQSSANDWTYAVNISGNGTGHTLTVNGGTYEGANVINVHGANNTVTVKDATLTSLYPADDVYYGAAIWVLQKQNSSVEATGNTFEGNHAIAFNLGTGTVLNESNNTDNTKLYVAKADADKYCYTFADAVAAAENTVKLLFDQTDKGVVIDKNLTIDFNGKTYSFDEGVGSTGTESNGFQILKGNNVTLKNGTLNVADEAKSKFYILVQNYANLIVEDMNLDGTNLDKWSMTDGDSYVLSNNSGDVVVRGKTVITQNNEGALAYALDACDKSAAGYALPEVTVNEGVVINGNVEVSATLDFAGTLNGNIVINGVDGKVTTAQDKNVTTTVAHYNVIYADGAYAIVPKIYVAKIGEKQYEKFADALTEAKDGERVVLLWNEGKPAINMAGSVYGKNVIITGTATVDWSKGFLFVGRGGEGDATVTFDGANLTSASNQATYGIHVSGREKNTDNKYDGTVVIKNSTIELDYLINKGAMTLDNSTLTVKNGFSLGGRPAKETESGVDATATMNVTNNSKLVVNNYNGMGLGHEAIGVMNIDKTSTFETTQKFLITAKGTMNNAGTVKIAGALTNNGAINFTDLAATLATETQGLTINHEQGESWQVIYDNGVYRFAHYVARIDNVYYESLEAALNALKDGETLVLIENIEISDKWSTIKTAAAATIDGADHTLTFTGEVNDGDNYNAIFRFENNMAVKNLTIDASQVTTGIERGITAKLGITVNNCEFIGKGNGYAVIFGEGAEVTDLANVEVSITNSKFTNWSKGVSDNANGEDAKKVTISDNTFDKASVNVSAREYVNFTKNTVEGGDVIITSYSNAVGVEVQAGQTGSNRLDGNGVYQIISNPVGIFAQAQFSVPVAYIGTTYYLTLQEAVNVDNSNIFLVDDVKLTEAVVVEGKKATLNLNGNFIKPIDNSVTMTGGLIRLLEDANLTINGEGEITSNGNHNVYAAVSVLGDNASLTVNSGKLTGYYYGIAGNGYREGTEVTINGGEIASIEATGAGIYHPQNGTLTVTGGTITGATGIYFKGGDLAISGGTVKGTGAEADYVYSGNGFNATGDALVIENVAKDGYEAIGTVSITGGTFKSDNAAPIASYAPEFSTAKREFLGEGCYALFNNNEIDESLLVVGYQLDKRTDGFYGVKWTNYRQSMVFVDGEFTEYTHTQDMTVGELTYIRNIGPSWNAIYLPFEIPMSMMADYDVTYINDIRQSDTDKDGEVDKLFVEQIYIVNPNATLKANYPYIIRPKTTAAQEFKITLNNGDKGVILYAATNTELTCSSILAEYKFTGNTRTLDASELAGKYALGFDGIWYHSFSSMKPFRMYFEINERAGAPVKLSSNLSISMRPYGEEQEDGTTLIYDVEYDDETVDYIYDLHGRRVMEPQKGGIYIINGKKVVF